MATSKMRYELKLLSISKKPNKLIERINANSRKRTGYPILNILGIWHLSHCCDWNLESIIFKYSYFSCVIRHKMQVFSRAFYCRNRLFFKCKGVLLSSEDKLISFRFLKPILAQSNFSIPPEGIAVGWKKFKHVFSLRLCTRKNFFWLLWGHYLTAKISRLC